MKIAVVGLGLIGGSIAKAIKQKTDHTVFGLDKNDSVVLRAKMMDAIDTGISCAQLNECDLSIIALNPSDTISFVKQNLSNFKKHSVVMDCCGDKFAVCNALQKALNDAGVSFVGGHPMAGREYSGFAHSKTNLFEKASMVLTPDNQISLARLDDLRKFCKEIGFSQIVITTPTNHDQIIAYTSQLAHVVSNSFVKSPMAKKHKGFSAGSFKDLTRVAKLNASMWTELFFLNKQNLLQEIDVFLKNMQTFRDAFENDDNEKVFLLLKEGSEIKEAIDKES